MIIEVKETIFQGIILQRVDNQGWRCQLGKYEYLFPTFVDAQAAINEIFRDIEPIVTKHKGKKYKVADKMGKEHYTVIDAAIDVLKDGIGDITE